MVKKALNENDHKLLSYCEDVKRSISQIAKFLDIAPKNVSVRIDKLKDLIMVEKGGAGKQTFIRTKIGNKTKKYMVKLLKEIKKRGGEVSREEYDSLLSISDWTDVESLEKSGEYDKISARWGLLINKYLGMKYFMTEKGKQFLKDGLQSQKETKKDLK